jgi:CHAT domain-containing protein
LTADDQPLTVDEKADAGAQLRLATLSACETAVPDFESQTRR